MATLTMFPDVESALMFVLVPQFPDIRFVTSLPSGPMPKITTRIARSGGGNRKIWVDEPSVEIDTWGFSNDTMAASIAAREIQSVVLSLSGVQIQNGVIQHVSTISGPRALPEVNPSLCRYNASYIVRIHP
jgi:hypothetical protein